MSANVERQLLSLGNMVSFRTGKLNSNAAVPDGRYPFFTCSQETFRTNTYSFDADCVLLAGNNANGVCPLKYYEGKFDAYQRTYVIRSTDDSQLSNKYLYYALRPQLERMRSISTGAATKFLTLGILDQIRIELPPLRTQRKIAAILSAYDDLIENNTRRIKILEEMAQTIYREWFVNFRFPGHENVKMVESELGPIPEGWEVKRLGEVVTTLGGGTPSTKSPEYWESGTVNWYTPSDLTASGAMFLPESSKKITELGLAKSSAKSFPPYCVMMTSRATIGVVAMNSTEACTNQGFIICIPNQVVSALQIYFWIIENRPMITSVASGATFKEISRSEFRELPILIAPENTRNLWQQLTAPVSKEIEVLEQKNRNLRRTRDLLLPKLVSGEVDVSELEIDIPEEVQF